MVQPKHSGLKLDKKSAKVDRIAVDQKSFKKPIDHPLKGFSKKNFGRSIPEIRSLLLAKKYFEFSKPFILQFFRLI